MTFSFPSTFVTVAKRPRQVRAQGGGGRYCRRERRGAHSGGKWRSMLLTFASCLAHNYYDDDFNWSCSMKIAKQQQQETLQGYQRLSCIPVSHLLAKSKPCCVCVCVCCRVAKPLKSRRLPQPLSGRGHSSSSWRRTTFLPLFSLSICCSLLCMLCLLPYETLNLNREPS